MINVCDRKLIKRICMTGGSRLNFKPVLKYMGQRRDEVEWIRIAPSWWKMLKGAVAKWEVRGETSINQWSLTGTIHNLSKNCNILCGFKKTLVTSTFSFVILIFFFFCSLSSLERNIVIAGFCQQSNRCSILLY